MIRADKPSSASVYGSSPTGFYKDVKGCPAPLVECVSMVALVHHLDFTAAES